MISICACRLAIAGRTAQASARVIVSTLAVSASRAVFSEVFIATQSSDNGQTRK